MSKGLSIRMIRDYKPSEDRFITHLDAVIVSCQWLGHTFDHNPDEDTCTVCGKRKDVEASHA